jgi:hypothetical protein
MAKHYWSCRQVRSTSRRCRLRCPSGHHTRVMSPKNLALIDPARNCTWISCVSNTRLKAWRPKGSNPIRPPHPNQATPPHRDYLWYRVVSHAENWIEPDCRLHPLPRLAIVRVAPKVSGNWSSGLVDSKSQDGAKGDAERLDTMVVLVS